jgi:hypothetical protein
MLPFLFNTGVLIVESILLIHFQLIGGSGVAFSFIPIRLEIKTDDIIPRPTSAFT